MKRLVYAGPIIGHLVLVGVYWLLTYDDIGTVLLFMFGVAVALLGWMLIPTFGDVGPTAPVDNEWHERRR